MSDTPKAARREGEHNDDHVSVPRAAPRRGSPSAQQWHVECIETVPMTQKRYDQVVTILAAMIGRWNERRARTGGVDGQ
jgi:hypothetical protein